MEYTIHGLHEKLVNKDISSVELTKKIIAHRNLVEGEIHAFLSTSDETALERAAEVDKRIASGERISELAREFPGQLKIICALRDSPVQLHRKCWRIL